MLSGVNMNVFISWSGIMSQEFGESIRNWLPSVLQMVKPYFTPNDIEKGARWSSHISKELEASKIGLFCLTRENLNSPWIMFEAGAISKIVGESSVCPILFGIGKNDVTGPLSQFQLTTFDKEEMAKLIVTINEKCGEQKLLDKTMESVFEMWWTRLEKDVNEVVSRHSKVVKEKIRSDRDLLEEILSLTRLMVNKNQKENIDENEMSKILLRIAYSDFLKNRPSLLNTERGPFDEKYEKALSKVCQSDEKLKKNINDLF
jgi:hypothetical protein